MDYEEIEKELCFKREEREAEEMNYGEIEKELKAFILNELKTAKNHPEYTYQCRGIAYGALQFTINHLMPNNKDLSDWWTNEIWPQFC